MTELLELFWEKKKELLTICRVTWDQSRRSSPDWRFWRFGGYGVLEVDTSMGFWMFWMFCRLSGFCRFWGFWWSTPPGDQFRKVDQRRGSLWMGEAQPGAALQELLCH